MDTVLTLQDSQIKSPIEIIEDARNDAHDILHQAKREQEEIAAKIQQEQQAWEQEKQLYVEAAQKEGYQHGWEEGNQQGYAAYLQQLEEAKNITLSAKEDYDAYLESAEKTILELSIKIAGKILDAKIEENNEYFLSLLKRAVKEVKEHQSVQMYIHPEHYQSVITRKEELLSVFPHQANLNIYPDHDLPKDGCIIESDYGRIDASIDTQLTEIKRRLGECLESNSK
jgi:flagellar assembly protein FliH